jgi:dipeptidyl-peptidase 4
MRSAAITLLSLLVFAVPPAVPAVFAQEAPQVVQGPGSANYRLATRWAPYQINDLVDDTQVNPRWIEGSEKFWYDWDTSDGTFHYIVDPVRGTKTQIFDRDALAAELTRITRDPYDAQHLPIRAIRFLDENTIEFEVESSQDEEVVAEEDEGGEEEEDKEQDQEEKSKRPPKAKKKVHHFRYDVGSRTLRELQDFEEPDNHPRWANISPDGETVVFARNHNLFMMSGDDYQLFLDARRGKTGEDADKAEKDIEVEEIQLTTDGEDHYSYAQRGRGETDNKREETKDDRKRASGSWSKNSQRFALVRSDQREVGDLWVIHSVGNKRPELETYRYDMPGEDSVTTQEMKVVDLPSRTVVDIDTEAFPDQSLSIAGDRQFFYPDSKEPRRSLWLSDNPDELYFYRQSRDRHRVDLVVANASTGESRVIIEERLNTYTEVRNPELLSNGDILWWSERDGWAHIYRYGNDGTLKNRLTSGPFSVRSIMGLDEAAGRVFLLAAGHESGEDPYYQHMYRVGLDGSGLTLLNDGDFDHRSSLGPSTRYFVDNYSRVNTVPQSVVRDASGREVISLETADFTRLEAAGWQMPEPYVVKAADGITNIYGNMYKPFDFDPNKKYPIIAYVYPGPQTEAVSKFFSTNRYEVGLAQFGFIVVTMGNRGGHPSRSKWYHNYGYGNLRDYGLADKKATIEQLADQFDFVDMDRVGIYGHSGGGFMSTAAMLVYPDFFDVAVSSSGNHNNDVYNRWWSETHHGVKEVTDDEGGVSFEYDIKKNSDLAGNLKGHLLLTTGDIDNNVHPAGTLRMAEALIKANKRFDFFTFPGQRHGYGNMGDYWFWLRAEYFVKHLLGDSTGWNADIIGLQLEKPKTR